jgi:hypothetical protein
MKERAVAQSDRALRRMVGRLPTLSPGDFDAVLDALSLDQRNRVLELLKEFDDDTDITSRDVAAFDRFETLVVPADLSPWLVARVNGNPRAGDEVTEIFSMTDHAAVTLRECAAEIEPQPARRFRTASLFSRLWATVSSERLLR